jgi:hypothetical protein
MQVGESGEPVLRLPPPDMGARCWKRPNARIALAFYVGHGRPTSGQSHKLKLHLRRPGRLGQLALVCQKGRRDRFGVRPRGDPGQLNSMSPSTATSDQRAGPSLVMEIRQLIKFLRTLSSITTLCRSLIQTAAVSPVNDRAEVHGL